MADAFQELSKARFPRLNTAEDFIAARAYARQYGVAKILGELVEKGASRQQPLAARPSSTISR